MTRFGAVVTSDEVTVPFKGDSVGPPTSGTYEAQDVWMDEAGEWWVCTVGGTPGTWWNPSGGKELAYAEVNSGTQDFTNVFPTLADITGITVTFDAPEGRPYMVEVYIPAIKAQAAAPVTWGLLLVDSGGTIYCHAPGSAPTNGFYTQAIAKRRFTATSGSQTYKAQLYVGSGDTVRTDAVSGQAPYWIRAWAL